MAEPDERSWAEAIGMYARRYTIAKVTRREHEYHAGEFERLDDPFYPFVEIPDDPAKADALKSRVHEIPRFSAKKFLVALSTLWLNVEKDPDFEERRPGLEQKADVILSRFTEGSHFYANTGRDSADID